MRTGRVTLLAVALAVGAQAAGSEGGALERKVFGKDVEGRPLPTPPSAASPLPQGLVIGAPVVRVEGARIVAELSVSNPAPGTATLDVDPVGGAFPYGGESPFTFDFVADGTVEYSGRLYPPSRPLPMRIILPPRSEVVFPAAIDLANWSWKGAPEATVSWAFRGLRGPLGEGRIKVRLPAR